MHSDFLSPSRQALSKRSSPPHVILRRADGFLLLTKFTRKYSFSDGLRRSSPVARFHGKCYVSIHISHKSVDVGNDHKL